MSLLRPDRQYKETESCVLGVVLRVWSFGRVAAGLGLLVAGLVPISAAVIPHALPGAPSASATLMSSTTAGPAGGDAFVPVRAALLVSGKPVSARSPLVLPVAGHGGVPASGVAAGVIRPGTASLSYAANIAVTQLMVVPPGSGGGIDLALSAGSAKVSAEVVGYDALPGAAVNGEAFVPVTAARVASLAAVRAGSPVSVRVTGRAGIPATGVGAVVAQVSATSPALAGSVAVYRAGGPRPPLGSVSYGRGVPSTALVVVAPGTGGNVTLSASGGATGATVDVVGYYALPGTAAGSVLTPVPAARIMNTATGTGTALGPLKAASPRTLTVTGARGVPATGVTGVLLEVTSAHASAPARVTVYPAGAKRPAITSASLARGGAATALVPVRPGTGGKVSVAISAGQANVAVDEIGYYVLDRKAPAAVTGLKVAQATSLAVTLSWTDPADADFADVVIRQATGSVQPATVGAGMAVTTMRPGVTSYVLSGLSPVTAYSFSVFARDSVGNTAKAASITLTTPSASHSIGGTVSGLSGTVVLQDNGASTLSLSGNGPFAFASLLHDGAGYNVTVRTYPTGQTCAVAHGSGAVAGVNVTNVAVSCANNAPSSSASDNFARANGTLGPDWTDIADGGMAISGQAAIGGAGVTGDTWTAASFTGDQFAQITLTPTQLTGNQWIGAAVRASSGGQDAYVGLYSA